MRRELVLISLCVGATTTCATMDLVTLSVTAPIASETGTMRFADTLTIDDGRGHTLTRETSVELGIIAPIVDRVVALEDETFLILGWAAWSGADRAIHAMLVRVDGSVVEVTDELSVTRDLRYGEIGFAHEAMRLGILAEGCFECSAADRSTTLDEVLVAMPAHGERSRMSERFSSVSELKEMDRYCPLVNDWCSLNARPLSVAWLTIESGTFRFD